MRTFIAIEIDPKVKENLNTVIHRLKKVSSGIKWVKPAAMHLTLKFLGNIDKEKAKALIKILDKISQNHNRFDLSCTGIGTFPQMSRKPRVIWAGIDNNSSLGEIYKEIETECEKIGFSKEKRSFHPHFTLGRVKKKAEFQELVPKLESLKNADFGKTNVDRLTLFKSTLTPQGAIYDILHESIIK